MKKLLANLWISRIIFGVILVLNLLLPLMGKYMQFNVFHIAIVIIWFYGLLSHLGYFKVPISDDLDEKKLYEPDTPIVQIGVIRLVEIGYLFIAKKEVVNWKILVVLLVLDVFYIAFLLIDKANYYFESEADDDGIYTN